MIDPTAVLRIRDMDPLYADRAAELISVTSVFLALATAGMAARIASKQMKKAPFTSDDYILLAAYVLTVGECGVIIWASLHGGLGRHQAALPPEEIVLFEEFLFAITLLQITLLALAKISVLILLRRIFVTPKFRMTTTVLLAVVVAWWIAIFFANTFACLPIESRWNPDVPAHCGNQYALNIVAPIPWIVTDFAILIAPLPMLKKLHAPWRQRVALGFLFFVGGCTCIISCVRYKDTFYSEDDATWTITPLIDFNVVEATVTVFCASLFASMPVAMWLVPHGLLERIKSYLAVSGRALSRYRWSNRGASTPASRPTRKPTQKFSYEGESKKNFNREINSEPPVPHPNVSYNFDIENAEKSGVRTVRAGLEA